MVPPRFTLTRLAWLVLPAALAFSGPIRSSLAIGPRSDEPLVAEPGSAAGGVDEPPSGVAEPSLTEPSATEPSATEPSPTEPGFEPAAPTEPGASDAGSSDGSGTDSDSGDAADNVSVPDVPRGLGVVAEFGDAPFPRPLLERLDLVSQRENALPWVQKVVAGLRAYAAPEAVIAPASDTEAPSLRLTPRTAELDALSETAAEGGKLAETVGPDEASEIRLAVHALERWLAIRRAAAEAQEVTSDSAALIDALAKVDALLGDRPGSADWRAFLLLPELSEMLRREAAGELTEEAAAPAFTVLNRIRNAKATAAAHGFLSRPQLIAFADELQRWSLGSVNAADALDAVRVFENSGDRGAGRFVAAAISLASRSGDAPTQAYATALEQHYRGPNVRLSVHNDLINRFMPQPQAESAPVREMIADHPVTGRSTAMTRVEVRLVPDPQRVSLELHAKGNLWSRTIADASVARFATLGHSEFQAISPVRIDAAGVSIDATQVYVAGNTRLLGISTDLENVPIIGGLVENYARSRHDEQKDAVKLEMESRVGQKLRDKLDSTLHPKLAEAQAKWKAEVLAPLARLSLQPELSDFLTTPDRIVVRTRLATGQQLASYTPRPMAPGDSLASVQLHESALNNGIEQLGLGGRRMSVFDIRDHIAAKLQMKPVELPKDDVPTDLFFTFADDGAVQVRCLDGVVELTLRLRKLEVKDRSGDDLTVRVRYRLEWKQAGLELVRDGNVQLIAENQSNGKKLFLRAVFLKVFPKSKPLTLVEREKLIDPRLADLTITQLQVRDGWVSTAIGKSRRVHTTPPPAPPALGKPPRAANRWGFPIRASF